MGLALRKQPLYLDVHLHPKQQIAFDTLATEVLYGGAAGGGKSHLMRVAAIAWCMAIPGLQVYIFRRVYVDLIKNHMEGPKGFRALLAPWVNRGLCKIVDEEIRFPNGSKIYLCHCKDPKDVYKYQGAEIHVLIIDELTHFLEDMYRFLRNRVRMVGITLPDEYKGRFPRILCSANPGNIGHLWVKETWIAGRVPLAIERQPDSEGGLLRQYIPARLDDNPSLREDDPGYEARLAGLGSAALVRAMRDGDWDVIEGAFFEEICDRHRLKPFETPDDWTRFIAMDWGSAKPFSIGWYAVVGDEFVVPGTNRVLPRGALVRYREWYGCAVDPVTGRAKANTGLKLEVEAVAAGIKQRSIPDTSRGIKYAYVVVDPAMYQQDGGPSHAERMIKAGIRNIRRGDNARVPQRGAMGGWDMMRARLRGEGWDSDKNGPGPDWRPMLYVFETCVHWWRTVPPLQHDPDRPEDVQTNSEDHAGDETRYACMSRPWVHEAVPEKKVNQELTFQAVKQADGTTVLTSNKTVWEIVEEKARKRKRRGRS